MQKLSLLKKLELQKTNFLLIRGSMLAKVIAGWPVFRAKFNMDLDVTLFVKRAFVLGHRTRTWGLYEIATFMGSDSGDRLVQIMGNCETDVTPRRFVGPPRWIIKLSDDPEGEYFLKVNVDDVIAFLLPEEIKLVENDIQDAYSVYLNSKQTVSDWDAFEVMARILVSEFA
jgi:hypothetical protein